MGKFKLACHLIQFAGEQNETLEKVFREVAEAGWNGVEGIGVSSGDELVERATLLASSFVCILSTSVGRVLLLTLLSAITLDNDAAEVHGLRRSDWGGNNPTEADFKQVAQTLDEILYFCDQHNIKGFHHAHLGTMIATVEDTERC